MENQQGSLKYFYYFYVTVYMFCVGQGSCEPKKCPQKKEKLKEIN